MECSTRFVRPYIRQRSCDGRGGTRARIIEKHIILDRSHPTADAPFSLTGDEFKTLVRSARLVKDAIGSAHVAFGKTEKERLSKKWRRSIFVVKDIKKGEKFVKGVNVRSIRPADGPYQALGFGPRLESRM